MFHTSGWAVSLLVEEHVGGATFPISSLLMAIWLLIKRTAKSKQETNLNISYYIYHHLVLTKWLALTHSCCFVANGTTRDQSQTIWPQVQKSLTWKCTKRRGHSFEERGRDIGGDLRSVSRVKCVCRKNRTEEDREPTEARLQALISDRGCLQAAISSRPTSQGLKRHQSSRIHLHCIIYRYRFLFSLKMIQFHICSASCSSGFPCSLFAW